MKEGKLKEIEQNKRKRMRTKWMHGKFDWKKIQGKKWEWREVKIEWKKK